MIYEGVTGAPPMLEITGPALEARELMDKGYSLTELGRMGEAVEAYDRAIRAPTELCVGVGAQGTHPAPARTLRRSLRML